MKEFLLNNHQELVYLFRIIIAGICGLVLGIERSKRQKEAGIRTHFVVACASALIMTVSVSFSEDSARVAAQIVSGIGFLCAGMIFFRRESLHGLTTAAGVWATAGIGMAVGKGLYVLGVCATIVIFVAQSIFHSRVYRVKNNPQILLVKFLYTENSVKVLKDFFKIKGFSRFKVTQEEDKLVAEAVIRPEVDCSADKIVGVLTKTDEIFSIERLEDL